MKTILQPHQREALDKLKASILSGKRRPMLVLANGLEVSGRVAIEALDQLDRPYFLVRGENAWSLKGEAVGTCMTMKPRPIAW
jgi:hypothetical protein